MKKSLMKSLLFAGLCLVPALAFAAPDDAAPTASAAAAQDAFTPAGFGICSESPAPQSDLGADVESSQDCEMESGWPVDVAAPMSMEKKPGGCKACPNQPWCACTYQGHPRISCDPCCYQTYAGEICTS